MKKIIDAMDKGIGMLEKIVLFGSITVMLIVTAIEVLDAKVLHANLMWTTEVNRIMLVWCILSGASVAAGTRSHLGVEFLEREALGRAGLKALQQHGADGVDEKDAEKDSQMGCAVYRFDLHFCKRICGGLRHCAGFHANKTGVGVFHYPVAHRRG